MNTDLKYGLIATVLILSIIAAFGVIVCMN
ncbi:MULTISPECIES: YnhF family membrane protein [unclassified Gilliamella]|nr:MULTISPECIES: YnhF family membrane protein [unclassified Gilliamella]MCX8600549.1 YnhF family membrane protein [Gilliamella sp. B3722]MCX8608739.1 YnhF family membrane protein [Gilliamella sp. B3771]MCX8609765.1 YnhF family membrane protein [Gilliamella sp. B3891]MCX8612145.1 YnhF family membrane protein [Gilliamella sp. B3773]MCX8616539.1 YnhF family membrane protein [Gilliamella sp. B3770]